MLLNSLLVLTVCCVKPILRPRSWAGAVVSVVTWSVSTGVQCPETGCFFTLCSALATAGHREILVWSCQHWSHSSHLQVFRFLILSHWLTLECCDLHCQHWPHNTSWLSVATYNCDHWVCALLQPGPAHCSALSTLRLRRQTRPRLHLLLLNTTCWWYDTMMPTRGSVKYCPTQDQYLNEN